MNELELYYRYQDHKVNGDLQIFKDALKEYNVSHCHHPRYLTLPDSTGTMRKILIPCGHCQHCVETRANEWVTRMYAHLKHYKYCYFITLTYRSFCNFYSCVNNSKGAEFYRNSTSFLMDYLKDAFWHYDADNATKHMSWNPCLICIPHFQNFLKRLRKIIGNDNLTYFACYEYGSTYGRPHCHMILFSKVPITLKDCYAAWSLRLNNNGTAIARHEDGRRVRFGHIDFNDLVNNGTITKESLTIDGKTYSAHQAFGYVCKYLSRPTMKLSSDNKKSKKEHRFSWNTHRVEFAFSWLKDFFDKARLYDGVPVTSWQDFNEYLRYHPDFKYPYIYEKFNQFIESHPDGFYSVTHVYNCPELNNSRIRKVKLSHVNQEPKGLDLLDFVQTFKPRISPSRLTPIGSLYVKDNMQQFSQGVFSKPPLQVEGYVTPTYFRRKADEYLYRYRIAKSNKNGIGFIKGNITQLLKMADSLCPGEVFESNGLALKHGTEPFENLSSTFVWKDCVTRERFLICPVARSRYGVMSFRYDKSKRTYIYTRCEYLEQWLLRYKMDAIEYIPLLYQHAKTSEAAYHILRSLQDDCREYYPNRDVYEDCLIEVHQQMEAETKQYINDLFHKKPDYGL